MVGRQKREENKRQKEEGGKEKMEGVATVGDRKGNNEE